MNDEDPKKGTDALKASGEQPTSEAFKRDSDRAPNEFVAQVGVAPLAPTSTGEEAARIRASGLSWQLDGDIARAMREQNMSDRMARELNLVHSPLKDILAGRDQPSRVASAVAAARKAMEAIGGVGSLHEGVTRASAGLLAAGGIEKMLRQQRELERTITGLGGIDSMLGRHSAMRDAVGALGGSDAILKRHHELNQLASSSLALRWSESAAVLAPNHGIERAMRDIAGVSSFTALLGRGILDRVQIDHLLTGAMAWRAGPSGVSLSATLNAQLPDLMPERRRATAVDIANARLSELGARYVRDGARLAELHQEMLRFKRPWIDVGNPGQSVSAYVDARALATIVATGPPGSRSVVTAVREELGDYRETDPVPAVVAADPVLRSAFRLEVGYNADLSSLPPAIVATVFGGFGGGAPRRIEADPDALESAVHQRTRRLELRLRRFIEKKMLEKLGPKWSKQRVPGKTVTGWRARRQTDVDNGRTTSRLFDYAGFEDYRAIIEQKDNWAEVFEPIFKVKTSILETLRRLSLIRNPDAHYRVVTIEDFLDLHTEGRRLDAWMDAAS